MSYFLHLLQFQWWRSLAVSHAKLFALAMLAVGHAPCSIFVFWLESRGPAFVGAKLRGFLWPVLPSVSSPFPPSRRSSAPGSRRGGDRAAAPLRGLGLRGAHHGAAQGVPDPGRQEGARGRSAGMAHFSPACCVVSFFAFEGGEPERLLCFATLVLSIFAFELVVWTTRHCHHGCRWGGLNMQNSGEINQK